MGCLIIGDDIKTVVEQTDSANRLSPGSALQNPELSRAQLVNMLRRAARDAAPRRNRTWNNFMAGIKNQTPANTNS